MSAIDFAYEHIGKYIKPGNNKTAWLAAPAKHTDPKKGDLRIGMGKNLFLITEKEVLIVSPYAIYWVNGEKPKHIRQIFTDDALEKEFGITKPDKIIQRIAYHPPKGKFMLFKLDGSGMPRHHLILNANGNLVRYSEPKKITSVRNDIMSKVHKTFVENEISPSLIQKFVTVLIKKMTISKDQMLSAADNKIFASIPSAVRIAIQTLLKYESVQEYITYQKEMKEIGA